MAEFLTPEWFDEAQTVLAGLAPAGAADVTVQYEVSSTPNGKVVFHGVVQGGRVVGLAPGAADQADVTVACSYEVAAGVIAGQRDPHGEYMTGGLKVDGAHALWLLDLHPLRQAALAALGPQS